MSKILLSGTKNKIKAYKAIVSHKRTLEITSLFETILKKNLSITFKKILNKKKFSWHLFKFYTIMHYSYFSYTQFKNN
jgi:hypothetical protein